MSVPLGIDFGNYSSVIGVARNRGIDVIVNEVSNRSTPSLVAFGLKSRFIGEAAKSQEISNLKNTVGSLKRILGLKANDPNLEVEKKFVTANLTDVNGEAGVKVRFQGKQEEFTSVQLAAMFLDKLKIVTKNELKGGVVSDVAIAVPAWYSDVQRRAAADAAIIAGLNPVRIVNDVTAAAVGYGVFKNSELPEDKPKLVAFVDVGNSDFTVSIGAFKKGELKILGTAYERNFGGRDVDYAIANHFAKIFLDKYKIDITTNAKAFSRVLTQAEKLKKILSANTTAPFNVESVMEDIDASSSMKRDELEIYIEDFVNGMTSTVEKAFAAAGVKPEDLDSVEVIGGTSRIPAIKTKLSEIFGRTLSFTLNQDEAIARGAAFICAIHSPTLRVRPFKFEDINLHSVTYSWAPVEGEDVSEIEVFPEGGSFPNTKVITLFRSEDFDIEARYTNPEKLEKGVDSWVGKWTIKGVRPSENGEAVAVKIKLRHDPSGLYTVESAYTAEEIEVEEEIPQEKKEGEDEPEPQYRTVKKWVKKDTLDIVHGHSGLDDATRNKLIEKENELVAEDKLVADTEDRKNTLEEYIYDIRGKLDGEYAPFASDDEKARLMDKLSAAENWLYDDGEDATKAQYIAKYEELTSTGNLIRGRYLSKIEEEKQARQAKQEAEAHRKMAEKLAADKAAREASQTKKDAEGDVELPDAN
ncbi:hypothetical protein DV451_003973 [Geotrichum candidum]|uniref:Similar to Saccharomyces cerevisiae YPL106C SSE1 ATPase that is a component of the heat shock protein Hsp90 chaperone complex n=1 Tax=Geotrichum candidum TaxID=1173061 RepID=A0A0J9X9E8_GEOCN|nr:hypothetical protein DV451_003973 [Geotrichum candidum]KAF5105318.1 hypothetical protein DV453_004947 [Geotrichum candidum]KAF5117588.1 hypothetical protein DV454_001072 [Geotrichum candidum]KAF5118545.1 hypothetical protein DV452_002006 [Geotrichum candidum]KAF5132199.1 hypothetical protein DV495_001506 [Geotrichum candidum]